MIVDHSEVLNAVDFRAMQSVLCLWVHVVGGVVGAAALTIDQPRQRKDVS